MRANSIGGVYAGDRGPPRQQSSVFGLFTILLRNLTPLTETQSSSRVTPTESITSQLSQKTWAQSLELQKCNLRNEPSPTIGQCAPSTFSHPRVDAACVESPLLSSVPETGKRRSSIATLAFARPATRGRVPWNPLRTGRKGRHPGNTV